jgi:hypothetical protein
VCRVLEKSLKRELCVKVLVEQTSLGGSGQRRNGEIRAHVMSEKECLSKPEWLATSLKRGSMTSR